MVTIGAILYRESSCVSFLCFNYILDYRKKQMRNAVKMFYRSTAIAWAALEGRGQKNSRLREVLVSGAWHVLLCCLERSDRGLVGVFPENITVERPPGSPLVLRA
jgi:hypothetical protein